MTAEVTCYCECAAVGLNTPTGSRLGGAVVVTDDDIEKYGLKRPTVCMYVYTYICMYTRACRLSWRDHFERETIE